MGLFRFHTLRLFSSSASATSKPAPQNVIEKIVQKYVVGQGRARVHQGDFVSISPLHVMTHDNTAAVLQKCALSIFERCH